MSKPKTLSDSLMSIMASIPRLTPGQIQQRQLEDEAVIRRDGWLEDSGDMPRMAWARADNPSFWSRLTANLKAALDTWDPTRQGLILLGPTGLGKTAGVVAALHRCRRTQARELPRFLWTTETRLVVARQAHSLGKGIAPLILRAQRVQHLIIDEVGPASNVELIHGAILDERYARGLPTTITTGCTLPDLVQLYSLAFVRRLAELATVVDLHEAAK